jgi:hypothetical protein
MRQQYDTIRFRQILGAVFSVLTIGISILAFRGSRPVSSPINVATLGKIHTGMQRAEVEALLGGAPGDYSRRRAIYDASVVIIPDSQTVSVEYSLEGAQEWRGDRMLIAVKFDRTGSVESAFGLPLAPPSWYRSLQRWLSLSWLRSDSPSVPAGRWR